jgi:hypothetical protein
MRILLSSAIAGTVTYSVVSLLPFVAWFELLLGVLVFIVVLVPVLLFSRAVTRLDVANLKLMVGGLGALGGLISRLLCLVERIMRFLKL